MVDGEDALYRALSMVNAREHAPPRGFPSFPSLRLLNKTFAKPQMNLQQPPNDRPTFGLLVGRCLDSMGSVVEFGAERVVDSIRTWKLENMPAQEPASLPPLP